MFIAPADSLVLKLCKSAIGKISLLWSEDSDLARGYKHFASMRRERPVNGFTT